MAKRLWDKGDPVNARMQVLTVGDDPVVDLRLVPYDVLGSAAHARMLKKVGILKPGQLAKLLKGLKTIYAEGNQGKFAIPFELEDVHTAIESRLYADLGEVGKRIHAGRSRNDQVCLAVRLYSRSKLLALMQEVLVCLQSIEKSFGKFKNLPMPGYTHLQPAMPSSVGMWLHSFYEGLLDSLKDGLALFESLNISPLGAAAGFGSNLPLDRKLVAKLLNFSEIQRSVIDVNNRRGKYEEKLLFWCTMLVSHLEKFACDLSLFSSEEFGLVNLPIELTTGSSIMPQKRNPDLAELLRARPSKVRAALTEMSGVSSKLPSSYHRDLQYTKAPLVKGIEETFACLEMFKLLVEGMKFNGERLKKAMYPELFATYYANNLVMQGMSFRDAYRLTAERLKKGELQKLTELKNEFATIQQDCLSGMRAANKEKAKCSAELTKIAKSLNNVVKGIF
jgi:argininosuccinate lyase